MDVGRFEPKHPQTPGATNNETGGFSKRADVGLVRDQRSELACTGWANESPNELAVPTTALDFYSIARNRSSSSTCAGLILPRAISSGKKTA